MLTAAGKTFRWGMIDAAGAFVARGDGGMLEDQRQASIAIRQEIAGLGHEDVDFCVVVVG